jgi:hypothetical protein
MNFFIATKSFYCDYESVLVFLETFITQKLHIWIEKRKIMRTVSGSKHGYRRNRPEHHLPGNNGI